MKKLIFLIINCIFLTSLAFGQITIDGNITETEWGTALSTSSGNLNSTVDANNKVNALYLTNENDGNFLLGIAGNIVFGNRILVFIDSKSGGYNDCSFDRTNAPPGALNGLNAGIIFDTGFEADYCLSIGRDNGNPIAYYFDLFKLSSTGSNNYLGSSADANFGANPSTTDNTKGFEARISLSDIEYSGTGGITVMVMYAADDGTLTNQFLSPANDGQGDYGNGAVDFNNEPPNPVSVSASILPVELATFYGKANHSTIDLYWTTLSEENNAGFDIEKSINGKDFEIIGHVEGAGNSIEKVDYGFIDNYPFNGLNYYRLKQTDFDGSLTYSKVISTIFNKKIDTKIFPNPARNQLYLAVNQQLLGTIRIIDINGQIIFSQQQLINNTTAIDLSNLLNGIYYLEIISDESQQVFSTTFSKL